MPSSLGQHSSEIMAELAYSEHEIVEMASTGAVTDKSGHRPVPTLPTNIVS
jgi:hypothetical protein